MRFFHCNKHNIDYPVEEGESVAARDHCPMCMCENGREKNFMILRVKANNDETIQTIHVRGGQKVEVALAE